MAIYNFGSVNIDHIYQVEHFVQPGETLSSSGYQQVLGGKGANQSVALARAGAEVLHVGALSQSDVAFQQQLVDYGVDCKHLSLTDTASGHAIIQITPDAENAIVLYGGANQQLSIEQIDNALLEATGDDWVLMQNETNALGDIIAAAKQRGIKVAFNPAPMTESVKNLPLHNIDVLIVNEVEAEMLSGESSFEKTIHYFSEHFAEQDVIVTLGKQGVCMLRSGQRYRVDAFKVDAKDTTAAGDTFIGFFLASYLNAENTEAALCKACAASALAVTQSGAAQSIPTLEQVNAFLNEEHK